MRQQLIALSLLLSACGFCKVKTNVNTATCVAEREFTQCGPKALALVALCIPYVLASDWGGLIAAVYAQAPEEAACIIAQYKIQIVAKFGSNSLQAQRFGIAHAAFKASR